MSKTRSRAQVQEQDRNTVGEASSSAPPDADKRELADGRDSSSEVELDTDTENQSDALAQHKPDKDTDKEPDGLLSRMGTWIKNNWVTLNLWNSQKKQPQPEPEKEKDAKPTDHPLQQKIAVPRKLLEKQQSRPLLEELLRQCHYDLNKMCVDPSTAPADHLIVVPCVNESRVGSDLGAAFQDAGMDSAAQHRDVIVVLFMPKAKHVPEHTVSTFEKMGDEFKVRDMVDVYFWDDDIYKCDTNDKAQQQMKEILKGKDLQINPQQ